MANLEIVGNVLLATGPEIYRAPDYRRALRKLLETADASASPVRLGTHDFWITYAIPSLGGGEFCCDDTAVVPREFRGIIRMGEPPDSTTASLGPHLGTMLQEVCHHWLVPADLEFIVDGVLKTMPTHIELTRRFNENESLGGDPILLGRCFSHWSSYFQADGSPMDGVAYREIGVEDGMQVWQQQSVTGATVRVPGSFDLQVGVPSDLDLYIMGVKSAAETYVSTGGQFQWIEPRLTSPLEYHGGLCVSFARNDLLYFGFHTDHRQLRASVTGSTDGGSVDLGAEFKPRDSVLLRIVRRGDVYYCQARVVPSALASTVPPSFLERTIRGLPSGIRGPLDRLFDRGLRDPFGRRLRRLNGLFTDLDDLTDPTASTQFRTVATITHTGRPEALGLIVKKWRHPFLIDVGFDNVEIRRPGTHTVVSTSTVPTRLPVDWSFSDLPSDSLRIHDPTGDGRVISSGQWLRIVAPYSKVLSLDAEPVHHPDDYFDHSSVRDGATKVVIRCPEGDFEFGSASRVERAIFTPWAAGFAVGKTIWGQARAAPVRNVRLSAPSILKWRSPPDNTFKFAFIIVASERSDVDAEAVRKIDLARRYWDAAFEAATVGRRASDSTLEG